MFAGQTVSVMNKIRVALHTTDANFAQSVRSAFASDNRLELLVVEGAGHADLSSGGVSVVIVDLNKAGHEELSGLERLINKAGHQIPVIAVLQYFNEVLARKLIQMRVTDLFVKPIAPSELVRGCIRIAQGTSGSDTKESKIYTFLPVAGGVGTTTLAIQSAMVLHTSNSRRNLSTCLIDLNFYNGACADYLDIEHRLDLMEIEPNPERLDQKMLEGMVSHHKSGLAVIASVNCPTETRAINQNVVMGLLNLVCQCYDNVVIDMPSVWHSWTDNVLLGSNKLFLVSEMSVPGVRRAKHLVAEISKRLGQGPHPKVIVNRFEQHFFTTGMRRADIMRALSESFACTVPYNHRLVSEAIDRGIPLEEIQKNNNVAAAIKKLLFSRTTVKAKSVLSARGLALSWARH